jgi:hypothetical protein
MNEVKKSFKKINLTIKNDKLSYRGTAIPIKSLFKISRSTGRPIPKSEDQLRTILKGLKMRFNKPGSIWTDTRKGNRFTSMETFRNWVKKIPVSRRRGADIRSVWDDINFRRFLQDNNTGVATRRSIGGVDYFAGERRRLALRHFRNMGVDIFSLGIERIERNDWQKLKQTLSRIMKPDTNYFMNYEIINGIDSDQNITQPKILQVPTISINSTDHTWISLAYIFKTLSENDTDYLGIWNDNRGNPIITFTPEVNENAQLERQRDGSINCACKIVLDELKQHKQTDRQLKKIKAVEKINKQYFETGINDEGLQRLADKSYIHLIIKDKIGEVWREFEPTGNKKGKKLLLLAHNNHISIPEELEPHDSDDEEEQQQTYDCIPLDNEEMPKTDFKPEETIWFDNNEQVIQKAQEYEREGLEGLPIISKGNLTAYITPEVIYKTKFWQCEEYPTCFTSGGVGKAKFIAQHPEYKYGITDKDPFYSLLMDADRSGFYCRTCESSNNHTKYDQNKSYKSFSNSRIFNGFPIIEAVFKIDKNFSHMPRSQDLTSKGLLYIETETLTKEKILNKSKIYYEASGWYPFEIVKSYYERYQINPLVKSWAYATETFDVDFSTFTNDQFRTFMGKCISKSYDEVWRTKDYNEFMRARYILRNRILKITKEDEFYQIVYQTEKKPWNMPVISAYVKAHQKYNVFQQYNKLIDNNILPVAVSVDGIEVAEKCDHLFDIGKRNGQWKLEKIYTQGGKEPMVIERTPVCPSGNVQGLCPLHSDERTQVQRTNMECSVGRLVEYHKKYILYKFLHIGGSGGNGKTELIAELGKIYPKTMFMAPTTDAVKNLLDRGVSKADTYHRVFGFGCKDIFPRHLYTRFILDECSMLSAENLRIIMGKLEPHQSLIMAGDFCQLPCIEATPIYDNWTGKKCPEYEMFEVRELTKNWRQKEDPEFFNLCNELRGKLSKSDALEILKKINTRVSNSLPENTTTDDIHICGINTQVDNVNKNYKLQEGTKVISNMQCKDLEGNKIPNGAIGIVECIHPLKINFNGSISTFKGVGKTKAGKPRFTPAYGLTIHRAQGKTIKRNVIINPSRLFSKNHLYVALTRATKFDSIYLTEKMTFKTFCKTVHVN